jgi:hypothetical protein
MDTNIKLRWNYMLDDCIDSWIKSLYAELEPGLTQRGINIENKVISNINGKVVVTWNCFKDGVSYIIITSNNDAFSIESPKKWPMFNSDPHTEFEHLWSTLDG